MHRSLLAAACLAATLLVTLPADVSAQPPGGRGRGCTAGADGAHFHHGKAHGQAINLALRNHGNAPGLHHRNIIGCAAHIHRDQIGARE
jgi:hypothetical protein